MVVVEREAKLSRQDESKQAVVARLQFVAAGPDDLHDEARLPIAPSSGATPRAF